MSPHAAAATAGLHGRDLDATHGRLAVSADGTRDGIGGVFLRARDSDGLAAWYSRHLGIPLDAGQTYGVFAENHPSTVWSTFVHDTDYWPADRQAMVNYTVSDLDALLEQLRDAGVEVDDRVETLEGIGRFGWAVDPEGNRFELWEPVAAE